MATNQSLNLVVNRVTQHLMWMSAQAGGKDFNSQDFRRDVSSLKDLKELVREEQNLSGQAGFTVRLEGETEDFAR